MLTIKKGRMTITREDIDFKTLQHTGDGIYMKFADNTEIIFQMPVSPAMKAVIKTVSTTKAKNIVFDVLSDTRPLQIER